MKKKIVIAVLIAAVIALGFFRDYIFVSINEKTGMGPGGSGNLFIWKWPLTFLFFVLYLAFTGAMLHVIFESKKTIWLAVIFYGSLLIVSFIASAFGYLFFSFEKIYPFVRTVMGIAQSPIVLMILMAACFFTLKTNGKKN